MSPPSYTTVGTKAGLCLLIDFPDETNTLSQADIVDFCNGDNYTAFGNNGSVKKYFEDNSNTLLTYTNIVTVCIRMARPKAYYNDTSKDEGEQANFLIRDAVAALKTLPNYATDIAPAFSNLTLDASNRAIACNVFFAGEDSGVWSYGLWPHSWALYNVGQQEVVKGIFIYKYQISDIGASLTLGTFCHENGHLLCGFPDIYDYEKDSMGGAGTFCLMNSGGSGPNPAQLCAYLKRAAGWATTVDLTGGSALTATLTSAAGADFNRFYRYAKPGVPTEYYLVENRQQSGRDATLPASGIAIWHIDERGSRDNQSLSYNTLHANYEVTLVQADNKWHFQNNEKSVDANDLYYSHNPATGYLNLFNDATAPSARWWDGSASGLSFSSFSEPGTAMTFDVCRPRLSILHTGSLPPGTVYVPYSAVLRAYGGTEPYAWDVVSNAPPAGLSLGSGGTISGTPTASETVTFEVRVTDATNGTAFSTLNLTLRPPRTLPFVETFENDNAVPSEWTQTYVTGNTEWGITHGGYNQYNPSHAHGGTCNASFFSTAPGRKTKLISPLLDFGLAQPNAQLSFWHCMTSWANDQDELRVYYKTAPTNSWILLASYTNDVSAWTERTLALPAASRAYFIAFEGLANNGYGVCVDDVTVSVMTPYTLWKTNWFSTAEREAGIITGDTDDPDGDGIENLLEYAMGLNPRLTDTTGLPIGGVWNRYLTLSYRQNKQATDLLYEVEACSNLLNGLWTTHNVPEFLRSDSNQWWQVTARHDVPVTNAPSRFMRLKVTLP